MQITPDNAQFTAYALDELHESDHKIIQTVLETNPEYRQELDEIGRTAGLLAEELAAEPALELTETQRRAIETELTAVSVRRARAQISPGCALSTRRRLIVRFLPYLTGAAALACITLIISLFFGNGPAGTALGQTFEQIQHAKFITWKITYYMRCKGKDGRTWFRIETRRCAYKAPGIYREESLGPSALGPGGISETAVADVINGRQMSLYPSKREAILSKVSNPIGEPDGPFASLTKLLAGNTLRLVETRKLGNREVHIFRHSIRASANPNGEPWSYDFWIDAQTKQLVEIHVPGSNIDDPENDPALNNPPGELESAKAGPFIVSEMSFDTNMDEALFNMVAPLGYTVQVKDGPQVTEKEMIDYLGILAQCNDNTFPDDKELGGVFHDGRNKTIREKPEELRTEAEQKFVQLTTYYARVGLGDPIGHFLYYGTVKDSFRYLGTGVTLGEKDKPVCWYKLKGGKTYRIVHGDLRVSEVAPESLPLPVEPR